MKVWEMMVNLIALLCNGSTKKSFTEEESVYVMFADLESGILTCLFL